MQPLIVSQIITLILLIISELLPFIKRDDINGVIQGVSVLLSEKPTALEPPNIVMADRSTDPPNYVINDQGL